MHQKIVIITLGVVIGKRSDNVVASRIAGGSSEVGEVTGSSAGSNS